MVDRLKIEQAEERHQLRKRIAELAAENERLQKTASDWEDRFWRRDAQADRSEALSRTGAVKVKALEWRGSETEHMIAFAEFGGAYGISVYAGMEPFKVETYGWWSGEPCGHYATLDAAKAAAQADYERRILSALEDHQRDTSTVASHETANVSDKPEGQQEPVAWMLTDVNGKFSSGTTSKLDAEVWASQGFVVTPLFTRPSEQAVTEAMELARAVLAQSITAGHNVPGPSLEDIEKAFWALDAALKAAMEAGG